jgi:VanZ family protein
MFPQHLFWTTIPRVAKLLAAQLIALLAAVLEEFRRSFFEGQISLLRKRSIRLAQARTVTAIIVSVGF